MVTTDYYTGLETAWQAGDGGLGEREPLRVLEIVRELI